MVNYEKKYLKYKNKYLMENLRQNGGSIEDVRAAAKTVANKVAMKLGVVAAVDTKAAEDPTAKAEEERKQQMEKLKQEMGKLKLQMEDKKTKEREEEEEREKLKEQIVNLEKQMVTSIGQMTRQIENMRHSAWRNESSRAFYK